MPDTAPFIRWFSDIGLQDVALVGGKNASQCLETYEGLGRRAG